MPNKAPTPPKANAKNNKVNSEIRPYPLMAHNLSYPIHTKYDEIPDTYSYPKLCITHIPKPCIPYL